MRDLGQKVRLLREKKGIGLNTFADQLGVSSGYLSNLETGKTENVQLSLLERLQQELHLFPATTLDNGSSDLYFRLQRIYQLLHEVNQHHPEAAEYLLTTMERGLDLWKMDKASSGIQ
jgi:transcriptional regulator with XRE-family HTH domain